MFNNKTVWVRLYTGMTHFCNGKKVKMSTRYAKEEKKGNERVADLNKNEKKKTKKPIGKS